MTAYVSWLSNGAFIYVQVAGSRYSRRRGVADRGGEGRLTGRTARLLMATKRISQQASRWRPCGEQELPYLHTTVRVSVCVCVSASLRLHVFKPKSIFNAIWNARGKKRSKNNKRNNKINNIQRVTRGRWWGLRVAQEWWGREVWCVKARLLHKHNQIITVKRRAWALPRAKRGREHAKSHEIKLKHLKIFIAYIRARYDVGTHTPHTHTLHPHTHTHTEIESASKWLPTFLVLRIHTHTAHTHINKDIKNWLVREGMSYVLRSVRCLAMSAWVTRANEALMRKGNC